MQFNFIKFQHIISIQYQYQKKYMSKKVLQEAKEVQIFSQLVEMKFKPINENGVQIVNKKKKKMDPHKRSMMEAYDPFNMTLKSNLLKEKQDIRILKFIISLSANYYIIGNQNQIDMISFGGVSHGFVDTEYFWSLNLKGPIEYVTVDIKKSLLLILSSSTIYFYDSKSNFKQLPVQISSIQVNQGVRFIHILNNMLLGVFYYDYYSIFNIERLSTIKKKLQKKFDVDVKIKLFTISPAIDNIINVYFQETNQGQQTFTIWCLQINFQGIQVKNREIYRLHNFKNQVKKNLIIQNFNKDIILVNLNNQIMIIKNGYHIDTANVSIHQTQAILKFIHPQTILHINQKNIEVYNFSINMAKKPEKIMLKAVDLIELKKIPPQAFYIATLQTQNRNFAIFFQDNAKKRYQTKGEIKYYFQLTQVIGLKQKIEFIFRQINEGVPSPQYIQEKLNIARKMGLTQKDIYFEIWNHSNRSSHEDFQYLLATKDYKIIENEIERKLKKHSMILREIIRIEKGCLEINTNKIKSSLCQKQDLQNFASSHFFMRKLNLYKEIHALERESFLLTDSPTTSEHKLLTIDIQSYNLFKNVDIKNLLVEQIVDLLFNYKNNGKIIRLIIKQFKFIYETIYKDILENVIKSAKEEIINLLNEIPQILPYIYPDLNLQERKAGLYEGIWGQISDYQWQSNIYLQNIQTLSNKNILKQFVDQLWYKRNWLTSHGLLSKSKREIIKINQQNNSQELFYFFIAKFYENTKNKQFYFHGMNFLEQKYEFFPNNLKGRSHLYEKLYRYYCEEEKDNKDSLNLTQFLKLDDAHLFKYFFNHQKKRKNTLLKEIKQIYEESNEQGSHIFNFSLLSYFSSDFSSISDLKYILNRINNEKSEFHQKNAQIYQVLVKSMQLKLRIGGENDIPMNDVMIYIKSIPFQQGNKILHQLKVMEAIKDYSDLFNKIKIDMTVKEIMDNYDEVISKIIITEINKRNITAIDECDTFRDQSLLLLKQVELIQSRIYNSQTNSIALLIYLTNLLQQEIMIEKVAAIFQHNQLYNIYVIEEIFIEKMVLFMYKWSFSQSALFVDNEYYIRKLLQLLPSDGECRKFLQAELSLGLLLSTEESPLEYPISQTSPLLTIGDIQQIFSNHSKQFLLRLNLQYLHTLLQQLRSIVHGSSAKNTISLHKIYEMVIVELLQKKLYFDVIDYIEKITQIESPIANVSIVYIILFIYRIAGQFNDECRRYILKIVGILFTQPRDLLKVIGFLIKTKLTGLEQAKYLRQLLIQKSDKLFNFNQKNPIFNLSFASNTKIGTAKQIIECYRSHLKTSKDEFQRSNQYDLIFTIICHAPFLLTKFIDLLRNRLQLRTVKSFLLLALSRDIFDPSLSFQLLKRVFTILAICSKENTEIDNLIFAFSLQSINESFKIPNLTHLQYYQTKLYKAAHHFAKLQSHYKKLAMASQNSKRRQLNIQKLFINHELILRQQLILHESEEDRDPLKRQAKKTKRKKQVKILFNDAKERKIIFYRQGSFQQFINQQNIIKKEIQKDHKETYKFPQKFSSLRQKRLQFIARNDKMMKHLRSHRIEDRIEDKTGYRIGDKIEEKIEQYQNKNIDLPRLIQSYNLVHIESEMKVEQQTPSHIIIQETQNIDKNNEVPISIESVPAQISPPQEQAPVYSDILLVDSIIKKVDAQMIELQEKIIQTYNQAHIPKFDLKILQEQLKTIEEFSAQETINIKEKFLKEFIQLLYNQPIGTITINLKLIEQIGRKHPQICINIFFLQAYIRIYGTQQKYELQIKLQQLLPASGFFIKSKDIIDLYHQIQPLVMSKITKQNIFKLSKLISLGFRKSIIEQDIAFNYIKILTRQYFNVSEEEKSNLQETIYAIINKISPQILADRSVKLFMELQKCERLNFLLSTFIDNLKKKGFPLVARELSHKFTFK